MTVSKAVVIGRCVGIVLVAVILQLSLMSSLGVAGVRPELTLLLAVAAGVAAGPDRGAVLGFTLGLTYDLFLQTPLGMTALVYAVVANVAGRLQLQMATTRRSARMLFVGVGSALGVVAWVLVGRLLDAVGPSPLTVLKVALVVGGFNAAGALAATKLWTWVFAPDAPTRVPS
ncbi:MAG: rod shape-determining protein MreD [Acidimicrobiia bacterium]